jgi:hypothetical protein
MTRAPSVSTWQSLESTDRSTEYESWATVARIPATLFAEIAIPIPVPQMSKPRSACPWAIAVATSSPT